MAPRPLPPVPQPLAKFEWMVARQSQTLVIKELLDSFTIETLDGKKLWMKVKASSISRHDRKRAYQPGQEAHPLFDIVRECHRPSRITFSIQDHRDDKEFMKVRRRFSGKWLIPNEGY